jgi:hypothetical protein
MQRQQLPDLAQREGERLGATDEAQALETLGGVVSIARGAATRLREEPLALVEADRIDPDSRLPGHLSDGERLHGTSPHQGG